MVDLTAGDLVLVMHEGHDVQMVVEFISGADRGDAASLSLRSPATSKRQVHVCLPRREVHKVDPVEGWCDDCEAAAGTDAPTPHVTRAWQEQMRKEVEAAGYVADAAPQPSTRPPQPSDMRAMRQPKAKPAPVDPRPVRAVSDAVLDSMLAHGWTPQQVREVIADYRALTRGKDEC